MAAPKISASVRALEEGARLFNSGLFFEAHEPWEDEWRRLEGADRAQVQAAILVCAVFVLLSKGRADAARRSAELALERFEEAGRLYETDGGPVVIEIPGAEDGLRQVLARIEAGTADPEALARGLKARVPPSAGEREGT